MAHRLSNEAFSLPSHWGPPSWPSITDSAVGTGFVAAILAFVLRSPQRRKLGINLIYQRIAAIFCSRRQCQRGCMIYYHTSTAIAQLGAPWGTGTYSAAFHVPYPSSRHSGVVSLVPHCCAVASRVTTCTDSSQEQGTPFLSQAA